MTEMAHFSKIRFLKVIFCSNVLVSFSATLFFRTKLINWFFSYIFQNFLLNLACLRGRTKPLRAKSRKEKLNNDEKKRRRRMEVIDVGWMAPYNNDCYQHKCPSRLIAPTSVTRIKISQSFWKCRPNSACSILHFKRQFSKESSELHIVLGYFCKKIGRKTFQK